MQSNAQSKAYSFSFTETFLTSSDWLDYCADHYQQLLAENLPASGAHITKHEKQPVWDMDAPPVGDQEKLEPQDFKKDGVCENSFDLLAWYRPLHDCSIQEYGIYFPPQGIVHLADNLRNSIDHQAGFTERQLIYFAANVLYLHECCHAYIERLVYAMEGFCGENDQCYIKASQEFGSSLMEEALCNSFITAHLKDWLKANSNDEMQPLLDTFSIIYGALMQFMRAQPTGYRNFIDLNDRTGREKVFADNCKALLCQIYDIDLKNQHLGFKLINSGSEHCDFEQTYFEKSIFSESHIPWHVPCYFIANARPASESQGIQILNIRRLEQPGYLKFSIGQRRYCYLTDKQYLKDLPEKIDGTLICNDIDLDTLEDFKGIEIVEDFYCRNNQLTNFYQIDHYIKSITGFADFRGCPIQEQILCLAGIKGLSKCFIFDDSKCRDRIDSVFNQLVKDCEKTSNNVNKSKFQTALFKAGFKKYAAK